jgi:hypothetical protein
LSGLITNQIPRYQKFQGVGEVVHRWIDFTSILETGDNIASITSLVSTPSGLTLASPTTGPNSAGTANQIVQYTCSGGQLATLGLPQTYLVTATVVTEQGETLVRSADLTIGQT